MPPPLDDTDAYRAAQAQLLDRILHLARMGWTPENLRHVAGDSLTPLLQEARQKAVSEAPTPVSAAWRRQCRPPRHPGGSNLPLPELNSLLHRLTGLPPLQVVDDLSDLTALRDAARAEPLTEEQQRARKRITGLLKKAESTTFAPEAESLVGKAQQLRQRYRIEHLDSALPEDVVTVRIHLSAPWVRFRHLLLANIATANSCRAVVSPSVGISALVGHRDDVLHTAELFFSLNRQGEHFMRSSPGAARAADRGETSAYRRSFLHSYASRIGDLLTVATSSTDVSGDEQSRALLILARRSRIAEAAFARNFPGAAHMSMRHRVHPTGTTDGIRAAEQSHLGPERTAVNSS